MIAISSNHVPCHEDSVEHQVDHGTRRCVLCRKSLDELDCPPGRCERVYSHNIELVENVVHRKWICRVCLGEGVEPMADAHEYQILKGRLLARESGGPVMDSPYPDLSLEYGRIEAGACSVR